MSKLTPMMRQYLEMHEKVKDAILFFRLGDFYEMFFDDAVTASRELELVLTGRDCGLEDRAPMCGVPYHSAENYIVKLIEKGYKVAICEQVEDPKEAKGLVKREITRIVTPGTVFEGKLLKGKNNNYLMSIYFNLVDFGIAVVDVSTGEFMTTQVSGAKNPKEKILDEIAKYDPSEIITNGILYKDKWLAENIIKRFNPFLNVVQKKYFNLSNGEDLLKEQFKVYSMTGLGLEGCELSIRACGALLTYLKETQMRMMSHIDNIKKYSVDEHMAVDVSTRRNLELTENLRTSDRKGSLLSVLDKTQTSMGGRKLKVWINQPLLDVEEINMRLEAVESLIKDISIQFELKGILQGIYDLERIMSKISYGSCNARDLLSLKDSLVLIPSLVSVLKKCESRYMRDISSNLDTLDDIADLLENSIHPEPPTTVKEGGIIRDGYDKEVDRYREINNSGKDYILRLEANEREKTGIKSLKIKYNKVFGYYIEVTKSNLHLVPKHYVRKQTLANSERFYTQELKEIENKILNSKERIVDLEYDIFQSIRNEVLKNVKRIKATAELISIVDVIYSFARVSYENNYVKPIVNSSGEIFIEDGRHPVVEQMLSDNEFVPNSIRLNTADDRMLIITGPNMAGKSTFIRQVAILTLMSQIGCFIPVKKAKIGVVDRIFTRVGASDDLALGQSTFMVEMSEVSNILKNATSKSLIVLDEIGRGTSTFDGLSIAWAVAEYISNRDYIGAKTLFATHYHELTQLENIVEGVKNYCIKVQETEEGVVFLRKIVRGGTDNSYGIEVAKLAGLPEKVVQRAREILKELEREEDRSGEVSVSSESDNSTGDDNVGEYRYKKIVDQLKALPLEELSPIEVMNYVYSLKKSIS